MQPPGRGDGTEREQEPRVVIIDPSPAYHRGLSVALAEQRFRVDEPDDLIPWIRTNGPSAVLWTVTGEQDVERLGDLAVLSPQVVMVALLTDVSARAYGVALRGGAHAAVGRDAPLQEIIDVLQASLKGRVVMPAAVARVLATEAEGAVDKPIDRTESKWIKSLARGETVSTVAHQAGYSDRAMHRHLHDLYRRLGAKTRAEALVRAARLGLLDGDAAADEAPERVAAGTGGAGIARGYEPL